MGLWSEDFRSNVTAFVTVGPFVVARSIQP